MTFRVRHKIDACQPAIIAALRAAGFAVQALSQGGGCPDLLVADVASGRLLAFLEVKMPAGDLTPTQLDWIDAWPTTVFVVRTPDEAVAVAMNLRSRAR